jgi:hypothetical protein
MKRRLNFVTMALVLVGHLAAQSRSPAASWIDRISFTADGTARWVENLSRTSAEPFRKDAETYELHLGASHHQQLAPDWLLNANADATWVAVPDYDLASHVEAGPRLSLQRKFGLGPLAPVLQLDTALTYKAARLRFDRGWTAEAGLRLAKRFTPEFQAGIGARWTEHDARSAVFDLDQHSVSIDAAWDLSDRWRLSGTAGRLSGNIVANAAWVVWSQAISGGLGATVFNYYTVRPWQVTEMYGSGWVSYNVEADVDLWSLAAAYAVSERTTADLRYSSAFVVNKIGIRYPTDSWGLSVTHRF